MYIGADSIETVIILLSTHIITALIAWMIARKT